MGAKETEDSQGSDRESASGLGIERIDYHGWKDCYRLVSAALEVIVVPAIGRVMQLRRIGDPAGVLWENRELDGQFGRPDSGTWANFGGDKCWPAPQSAWQQIMGHEWPPPAAFDAVPFEASSSHAGVMLKSSVDSAWGIEVSRHIDLDATMPVMRIRSEFRKVRGPAARTAIWTIAQFNDPACVAIERLAGSKFANGYTRLNKADPAEFAISGRLLTFARHPSKFVKIGSDSSAIAWVGTTSVVRMETEMLPGEYPDGGCRTEVYTNPGDEKYVELETLGPLVTLEAGQMAEVTSTYTVLPRTTDDARAQAENAL